MTTAYDKVPDPDVRSHIAYFYLRYVCTWLIVALEAK